MKMPGGSHRTLRCPSVHSSCFLFQGLLRRTSRELLALGVYRMSSKAVQGWCRTLYTAKPDSDSRSLAEQLGDGEALVFDQVQLRARERGCCARDRLCFLSTC